MDLLIYEVELISLIYSSLCKQLKKECGYNITYSSQDIIIGFEL